MYKYNKYNIGLGNYLPFSAGLWSKTFVDKGAFSDHRRYDCSVTIVCDALMILKITVNHTNLI